MASFPALLSVVVALAVAANPAAYEQNLVTALFLSCAWVLRELQSLVVVRSLILGLLQGEACHRTIMSYGLPSSNILWVTVFSLMQEEPVGVARLVAALAICFVAFAKLWNTAIVDAIRTRSQADYWSPSPTVNNNRGGDGAGEASRIEVPVAGALNELDVSVVRYHQPVRLRRSELGALVQLLVTRRLYDMLSRRSRMSSELREALQNFIEAGGMDREPRDKFTMAVVSALSRQGTATVIRTAESSHVGKFASRAAAFVERKFTASAMNRIESFFRPLPFGLDPAEQNGWQTFALLLAVLTIHKRLFQVIKAQSWARGRTQKNGVFLVKQTTRMFLVVYLMIRYSLGMLRRAEPIAPSVMTPSLLGEVRRQGNDSILLASPSPQQGPLHSSHVEIPLVNSVLRLDQMGFETPPTTTMFPSRRPPGEDPGRGNEPDIVQPRGEVHIGI